MTIYEKELLRLVGARLCGLSPEDVAAELMRIGVVDHTLCKVLAVREYVAGLQGEGINRTNAMWQSTERFACSYEYVRKCIYYYTDVNLRAGASESVENAGGSRD